MGSIQPDYAFPAIDSVLTSTVAVDERASKISDVENKIKGIESSNFDTVYSPATSASQNALTYGIVLDRNNTIQNIANDLTTENKSKMSSQRDTYSRQAEINEWESKNKMDTLFFLQLLFIFLSVLVVSLYLRQIGLFTNSIVGMIAGVGVLILGLILWNRASYTSSSRDQRYWNRRYLGLGDANLQAQIQCNITT